VLGSVLKENSIGLLPQVFNLPVAHRHRKRGEGGEGGQEGHMPPKILEKYFWAIIMYKLGIFQAKIM